MDNEDIAGRRLQRTPLYDLHKSKGANIVPFAGYEMPLQYAAGVMQEHKHCRTSVGLFDVSHMGQILLRPRSGDLRSVALGLETLVPVDIVGLKPGRQRYAFFTNDRGGILDDLMVVNLGEDLLLVVNAACKHQDFLHVQAHLRQICEVVMLEDRALVALQGPKAEHVLKDLIPEVTGMRFMDARQFTLFGTSCVVTRSGYTGEDGFEISIATHEAPALVKLLLNHPEVMLIGLAARDSLRLEAGMCLYGSDMDDQITPVQANLTWAIQKVRRTGGERQGGFPGAEVILHQLDHGSETLRVGLRPLSRVPIRAGAKLYESETSDLVIGYVCSGGFGPTVDGPVAMGYVPTASSTVGTELYAEVRGKRHLVTVAALPFITTTYKRT